VKQPITKQRLQQIQDGVENAIRETAKAYGVEFKFKGGKFSDADSGELRIEITNIGGISHEAELLKVNYDHVGFDECPLGKNLILGGRIFKVVGLKPKARKNKILIHDEDGKEFCTTVANCKTGIMMADIAGGPQEAPAWDEGMAS
tara:strand:- start:272 stop:709 length:438 start_codon:yes stop_codon:yes gene_type:complete